MRATLAGGLIGSATLAITASGPIDRDAADRPAVVLGVRALGGEPPCGVDPGAGRDVRDPLPRRRHDRLDDRLGGRRARGEHCRPSVGHGIRGPDPRHAGGVARALVGGAASAHARRARLRQPPLRGHRSPSSRLPGAVVHRRPGRRSRPVRHQRRRDGRRLLPHRVRAERRQGPGRVPCLRRLRPRCDPRGAHDPRADRPHRRDPRGALDRGSREWTDRPTWPCRARGASRSGTSRISTTSARCRSCACPGSTPATTSASRGNCSGRRRTCTWRRAAGGSSS